MKPSHFALFTALVAAAVTLHAADIEPIHENCNIGVGDKAGTLRLETGDNDCHGRRNCNNSSSDVPVSRFTGISLADLSSNGAHLTVAIHAEAGTLTCAGTVAAEELNGSAVFTPDPAFVTRMEKIGITGFDSQKLKAYALLDVQSEWARSLQQLGIHGITADNLIALHIFHVDAACAHSFTGLGYPLPTADQLISLSVQGVNAKEVGEIRALGYQPTLDQLIQIRIFKITPDFIHRMQARGLKNLTLEKLVQIRIFNLAD